MTRSDKFKYALISAFLDVLFSAASFYLAVLFKFDFAPAAAFVRDSIPYFIFITAAILILNVIFRVYSFKFKHMSIIEALAVMRVSFICLIIVLFLRLFRAYTYSLSITLIYLIFFTLLSEIYRFSIRSAYVFRKSLGLYASDAPPKNVLIISDAENAEVISHKLLQGRQLKFKPAAILTGDVSGGKKMFGLPVCRDTGDMSDARDILVKYAIGEVVLLSGYYGPKKINELKTICDELKIDIKVYENDLESVNSIEGERSNSLRRLNIEDLLGREEIHLEKTWVESFITGRKVLVTGAAGSIGSEICRQCINFGCSELYLLDFHENGLYEIENELKSAPRGVKIIPLMASIRDIDRLDAIFSAYKPDVCFHAAAHKHVPMMEKNPCEAIKNNVFGTINVLKTCDLHGVKKLIVISSDKAVNPSSVMGATKRVTEMLVQVYGKNMTTEVAAVRFGNVLGSNGSVVPLWKKQIEAGGPVTLTHPDMQRYLMTIPEAVQLVMQAGALAHRGEIFVFNMGKSVMMRDLAVEMIRLAGLEPDKDIEIKIIGLRPGEKLFEELRLDAENMDTTQHGSIFVCKPMNIDRKWLDAQLENLRKAAAAEDNEMVMENLFILAPSVYRKPELKTIKIQNDVMASIN